MKSILDPTFRYTPSAQTDLRKTFARVRRELRKQEQASVARNNVTPLPFPAQRLTQTHS